MDKMTFDFAFIEHSLLHGEFLCEVHQSCPGIKIEKVNGSHQYRANTVFLSVTVPEDIATVLKLRFGHCIVMRPPPKKAYDDFDDILTKSFKETSYKSLRDYITKYELEKAKLDYEKKIFMPKKRPMDEDKYYIDYESWADLKWFKDEDGKE